ncbi:uncharacterized protein K452DRAFT_156330 [Aplosporella prunicola CBS 121167]|uniref:Uncharacterized protein n=1 Tax=Aplosporella prunicola CBS 121167 TaxID=1176127 RepID=A0A6A6BLL1_9PEZI|nr:uncharacterized protein K452DRAFT_156330 [Aplosporella prunicola CBS 121167]KAF2144283.1 hypothetical protein K452DRAFT_156330 [Aplosporella prunicola CBS 121167]
MSGINTELLDWVALRLQQVTGHAGVRFSGIGIGVVLLVFTTKNQNRRSARLSIVR